LTASQTVKNNEMKMLQAAALIPIVASALDGVARRGGGDIIAYLSAIAAGASR